jgi:EmrB/QacA subfamily drug resistance transporter
MTATARSLPDARKNEIVVGVLVAMFLAALDQTIIAPALPTIGASLGDVAFLPWVASAYLLTSTAVTPLYGKFSDIHGRRPVLLLALGVFLAGSLLCALAPTMLALILGRLAQGLGGGGLTALAQTVIADVASPRERARFTAHISTVWASASIAGPVLGGFLAQHLSWTVIFWINLPIGGVALYVCDRILRDLPQERRPHRLDLTGSALTVAASLSLMLMLTLGGAHYPWNSPPVLGLGLAAVALGAWLFRHLETAPEPLLPLGIFANRVVGRAVGTLFFAMFAYVGAAVYLPIFFEYRLQLDATASGAGLIVLLGGTVIGSNFAGLNLPRMRHYKRLSYFGLGLALASLLAMSALAASMNFLVAEGLILALGIGLGPIFPTLTVSVQNAVDARDLGVATAAIAFVRNFGSAIGVAVIGAVIFAYGLQPEGGAPAAAATEAAALAFRAAFALMAVAVAAALVIFWRMEERPLRGPGAEAAAAE